MPKHELRHFFDATSVSADIPKDKPKSAALNFLLSNGQFLTVAVSRYALQRLPSKVERALREVPLLGRGPVRRRANFQNK